MFARMSGANREAILDACGSVQNFINELLAYDGADIPPQLRVASGRSEDLADSSLEIDQIISGEPTNKSVPSVEGRKLIRKHVTYERKPKNRAMAIDIHGTTCAVCQFNFDKFYGREYAAGYIQIHHVKPLAEYEGEVDPATDLVPLCANCHVMAHRKKDTVTPVEELKGLIEKAKG